MSGELGVSHGILGIIALDAIGRRLLLPVVDKFLKQWPDVQVEINFSDRVEYIIDEGIDLAIRVGVSTPPYGLIGRTLFHAVRLVHIVLNNIYLGYMNVI